MPFIAYSVVADRTHVLNYDMIAHFWLISLDDG
jgi:hypothetical protein